MYNKYTKYICFCVHTVEKKPDEGKFSPAASISQNDKIIIIMMYFDIYYCVAWLNFLLLIYETHMTKHYMFVVLDARNSASKYTKLLNEYEEKILFMNNR